jgi:hypothetical protein
MGMAYVTAEARQQLLDTVAEAADEIAVALAALGAAYEQLDEQSADRLEEELFRPVQLAYGRVRRAHAGFAERSGLPGRTFEPATAGLASQGVKGYVEGAVEAAGEADRILSELQDSMLPVDVGDPEVRARLAELRSLVGNVAREAREVVRTIGR